MDALAVVVGVIVVIGLVLYIKKRKEDKPAGGPGAGSKPNDDGNMNQH